MLLILNGCDLFKGLYQATPQTGVGFVPLEKIISEEKLPRGIITLDSKEETARLEVFNLPVLADTQNYEIWLFDSQINVMETLGTFKVNENGSAVINAKASKADISDSDAVIITIEEFPVVEPDPSNITVLRGEITVKADTIEVKLVPVTVLPREVEIKPEEAVKPATMEEKQKEIAEGAIVIIAQETELISLSPDAEDPDKDTKLAYSYTSPFNENGEWQTKYGDAGQYTVTITVSDGELSSSSQALVIVNKKEEPPVIQKFTPETTSLEANEDTSVDFSIEASDLNNDQLKFSWKVDNTETSTDKAFSYKLGFEDAGTHTVSVGVSDSTSEVSQSWSVNVKNVNRKPVLEKIEVISIKETETVRITPSAVDPDKDSLTFRISEPVGDDGVWETSYESAGTYTVTVSVTDGIDTVTQDVKITVQNVNRPPVIKGIVKR